MSRLTTKGLLRSAVLAWALAAPASAMANRVDNDGDCFCEDATSCTSSSDSSCTSPQIGDCDDGDADTYPGVSGLEADTTLCTTDADGDNYGDDTPASGVDAGTDCDDTDSAIFPGATELCDLVDNDCDGNIDEGVETTFFFDGDGDGFGDSTLTASACTAPTDYVADDTDCDVTDASINPGASEVCGDGVDNNCSGFIDGADSTVTSSDFVRWYPDSDGDSYGDDSSSGFRTCSQPTGFVSDNSDCDDGDSSFNPDATEVCDGLDNDCDADIDDADSDVDSSTFVTYFGDSDGDGFGDVTTTSAACDVPSGFVANSSDCDDGASAINPSATEVCDNIDNDCDNLIDDDDPNRSTASATTWFFDSDGDGEGTVNTTAAACDQPSGYVANSDDCDDTLRAINTSATEVCDTIDNDCDGFIDAADSDVDITSQTTYYVDADGDLFGDERDAGTLDCSQPSGFVLDNTDCDDAVASTNPGATELWYDGVDRDCDGADDFDADGDGDPHINYTGGDCHEGTNEDDEATYPNQASFDPADINSSATETWYDGTDQDCDGLSDFDADFDGDDHLAQGGGDCHEGTNQDNVATFPNDASLDPADINSSATETWYDGTDEDCDGHDDFDADFDNFSHLTFGGTDCHEGTSADVTADYPNDGGFQPDVIHPGASDTWYDGTDQDCDGADDSDADGDGDAHIFAPFFTGGDCNEGTALDDTSLYPNSASLVATAINSSATETWYDGTDQDCDGASDFDADSDGFDHIAYAGSDCHEGTSEDDLSTYPNDAGLSPASINPGSPELFYDGTDADCDGLSDYDADADGEDHLSFGGADCHEGTSADDETLYPNDGLLAASSINSSASETWYDGSDQDCDGLSDYDADGDLEDHIFSASSAALDCHEGTSLDNTSSYPNDGGLLPAEINTSATDVWYDGTDADCDGLSDYDADLDGYDHINSNSATPEDCVEDTSLDNATDFPNEAGLAAADINPGATETWYDGTDEDCDSLSDYDADYDLDDSQDYGGADCNDADETVSSLASEVCESGTQVDNDCDGDPNTYGGEPYPNDGQGVTAYEDLDGDSFGARWQQASDGTYVVNSDGSYVAYVAVNICSYESGWATNGTDCDDYDATIHPGAEEECNGIDEDCDNVADDPPADGSYTMVGCTDLYLDLDEDSFGDSSTSECLCLTGSSTSTTYNGDTYTDTTGDCVDTDPDIYPNDPCEDGVDNDGDGFIDYDDDACNTCLDGLDNDLDGFIDALDTVCADAVSEPQENSNFNTLRWDEDGAPIVLFVDGDDNDCDGRVLAIELDCDGDGSLAALPIPAPVTGFSYASDLGLTACDPDVTLTGQTGPGVLEIPCWSDQDTIRLLCDEASGMWMFRYGDSDDGYGGRYLTGKREYSSTPTCSGFEDCDDLCSSRCVDASESCDGVDNDCSDTVVVDAGTINALYAGLPSSMIDGYQGLGTMSLDEIDLDGDGVLSCTNFSSSDSQPYPGGGSCDAVVADTSLEDCNALCGLTFPAATERCDGFLGDCNGEGEGLDADGDGLSTCGAWGTADSAYPEEDIFLVVAVYGDGSATGGGDTGDTATGGDTSTGDTSTGDTSTGDTSDTSTGDTSTGDTSTGDTSTGDTSAADTSTADTADTGADTAGGTGLDTGGVTSFSGSVVPLLLPRSGTTAVTGLSAAVAACDVDLAEQLVALEAALGLSGVVDTAMTTGEPADLVSLCTSGDALMRCEVVQLTLTSTSDAAVCDPTETWLTGYSPDCSALGDNICVDPVEEITRTVWTPARILSSRRAVAEWECQETYGVTCALVDTTADPVVSQESALVPVDQAIAATAGLWWKEMGRYAPAGVSVLTGWCWGDPAQDLEDAEQLTGGDCDDSSGLVSRDNAEGPLDELGIWYARQNGDPSAETCSVCLDGLDNDCDGLTDCADPACAACFVGQGSGCGGGSQTPCAQASCSGVVSPEGTRGPATMWLAGFALLAAVSRRRLR